MSRPHGTCDKYTHEKCRCKRCLEAFREYKDRRRRLITAGKWHPHMDAAPVHAHLRDLMDSGLSLRAAAELSGVPGPTLKSMFYGNPARGRQPSRKVDVETGERILALSPSLDDYPPRAWIDATGTQRRLQALNALGWPMAQIAPHVGLTAQELPRVLRRDRCLASTYRAVKAAYDELWDQQPSRRTREERISVSNTLTHAKKNGWLPPAALDDDLIDLPDAEFQAALERQAAAMDDAELQRCFRAKYVLGDTTPLMLAGAREYDRRRRARKNTKGVAA